MNTDQFCQNISDKKKNFFVLQARSKVEQMPPAKLLAITVQPSTVQPVMFPYPAAYLHPAILPAYADLAFAVQFFTTQFSTFPVLWLLLRKPATFPT